MKLSDYEILNEQVFYRGWHILEYINSHDLTELDIEAIKATIMDALVSNNDIDPMIEFLSFVIHKFSKSKEELSGLISFLYTSASIIVALIASFSKSSILGCISIYSKICQHL